ncbi:uncharacterized protein LOC109714638 [Ananas comosus]|uniref:Uncharacterized protein LOC109714638 n=1 Tax=Ananas comosus TaxID=4615 RepID=A0A6P5FN65_ANACO|nr:uncharacterized protein LOC109714638 [Ananas comosus]
MTFYQPIAQFADGSIAEVTFEHGNRIFTTNTNSADVVTRSINEAVAIYGPPPISRVHQPVGLHIQRSLPYGAIALLQLFVGKHCLLYQLMHRDAWPPRNLYTFFKDERFCFTGASAEEVVPALQREFGFKVRVALDLGHVASRRLGREDLRWAGLEQLAMEMMRIEMMRPDEFPQSAWGQRALPLQLVAFACANSFISYELSRIVFNHGLLPFLYRGS